MVSPRKRTAVVGRLRSGAKGKGDSPENWVSGGSFLFTKSPVIHKREGNNRRVSNAGKIVKNNNVQNRRQSIIMKRLEMDLVASSVSPRRTRRQSMAVITASERRLMVSTSSAIAAPKSKPMLPPKKPAPTKSQESNIKRSKVEGATGSTIKNPTLSLSPLKFYSSPQNKKTKPTPLRRSAPSRRSGEGGKRKLDTGDSSNKVEPSAKKSKGEASSPHGRGQPRNIPISAKSSPSSKKTASAPTSPSAVLRKASKSAIPLRTVRAKSSTDVAERKTITRTPEPKEGNKRLSPVRKVKSPAPLKKIKTPSPQKRAEVSSAEEKVGLRITRNASQTKDFKETKPSSDKKLTSPTAVTPVKKQDVKSPKVKSPVVKPKAVMPVKKQDVKSPKVKSPVVKPKTEESVSRSKSSSGKTSMILKIVVTPIDKDEASPKKKATPKNSLATSANKKSTPTPKKDKTPLAKKQSITEEQKKSASPSQKIKTPPSKKKMQMSPKAIATPRSASPKRLTRSALKSSKRVSVVANSPQSIASSFRKTPGSKKTTFKNTDLGSSPMLSAKSQLVLIRSCSPLRGVQKSLRMKSKPYTPKPDSPPSNILKKSMKNKVSQQMKAVTQVEVHQLMNGEISKPVKIASSFTTTSSTSFLQSKVNTPISIITPRKPINSSVLNGGDSEIKVLATTPVSTSNLPPTPTSSRKLSESMLVTRHVTSQSITKKSCQRVLTPAAPRSSTPIEADSSVLESLNLGTVIKKLDKETNFTDDSINTDTSELETSFSDFKENKSPATDKKAKWSCLLM